MGGTATPLARLFSTRTANLSRSRSFHSLNVAPDRGFWSIVVKVHSRRDDLVEFAE